MNKPNIKRIESERDINRLRVNDVVDIDGVGLAVFTGAWNTGLPREVDIFEARGPILNREKSTLQYYLIRRDIHPGKNGHISKPSKKALHEIVKFYSKKNKRAYAFSDYKLRKAGL